MIFPSTVDFYFSIAWVIFNLIHTQMGFILAPSSPRYSSNNPKSSWVSSDQSQRGFILHKQFISSSSGVGTLGRPLPYKVNSHSGLIYFSRFKALWDEFVNYQIVPVCKYFRLWSSKRTRDHVMRFLIGLKKSYAYIRGQILLIEPLPNIKMIDHSGF